MPFFDAKSLCILGRQPQLGLAELEFLYGEQHVKPEAGAALLDIAAEQINFKRLGGTIKTTRILATLPQTDWKSICDFLMEKVPAYVEPMEQGKFTLGISAYGLSVSPNDINKLNLSIKKQIRRSGRPVRVVPNKEAALNSAQVLHNGLTKRGSWELVLFKHRDQTIVAQTLFVQDIEAYGARDQARPARDARVGMLPPKLAQIIINLAAGAIEQKVEAEQRTRVRVLDPFCGTGVILQEALLDGYSVFGTDLDERMVEYSQKNLRWLFEQYPKLEGNVNIEAGDATSYQWPAISCVASEVYLGRALSALPPPDKLKEIINDSNTIVKKFLANLSTQLKPGRRVCLALPAWRRPGGQIIKLPLIDHLTDMGYNYLDLKHVRRDELLYFREDQVVARQLVILEKK